MRKTKIERVREHLEKHGTITPLEAINEYGYTRLSDGIYQLRNRGYDIETETISTKDRYGDKVYHAKYILKTKKDSITQISNQSI